MASHRARIRRLLAECADEGLRGSADLWPRIQAQAAARPAAPRRWAAYSATALAGAALLVLALFVGQPAPPPAEPGVTTLATEGTPGSSGTPAAATPVPNVVLAQLLSEEELRERLPFALRTPAWLPDGLELEGGWLQGSGDALRAVLEYRPASREPGPAPLRQWVGPQALAAELLPPLAEQVTVEVNGRPAIYAEGDLDGLPAPAWLVWHNDGLSYALEARSLSREELVRIAESLH
jgi:hypothetical protein